MDTTTHTVQWWCLWIQLIQCSGGSCEYNSNSAVAALVDAIIHSVVVALGDTIISYSAVDALGNTTIHRVECRLLFTIIHRVQ